jgi:hypothetical protein
MSVLTVVELYGSTSARTRRAGPGSRCRRHRRAGSSGTPRAAPCRSRDPVDDVHVVAGLDDRADTGDLVHLDGHRNVADRPGCLDAARGAREDVGGDRLPETTGWRAIWPTTRLVSLIPLGGKSAIATSLVVTSAAWMVAPRSIAFVDTTSVVVVAAGGVLLGPPLPLIVTRINTNAMSARKIPMSRTNRFERFKRCLPESFRVTGGTTLTSGSRPTTSQMG